MKRYTRILLVEIILIFSFTVKAQLITLSGKVTDQGDHSPLINVLVTIRPIGESKIVKYTQTSLDGDFEFKLSSFPEGHVLHFSLIGYASQTVSLSPDCSQYDLRLAEQATELKEVVIKAPSIHERGDTITYIVSNFANIQDRSLGDVLKKMPGIEIEKTGKIKYNGVEINKFYIEGKDVLGGRYGLATNNLNHRDIGSIEVMENHQPIKALEDLSFSQNPAINVRLKEDAKARWVGTAKLGAGFEPFLWNAELVFMRFTARTQTLNTYKTNNTGMNIVREMQQFSLDELLSQFSKSYRMEDFISVRPNNLTGLDANRARFNKSHAVTTNNLWSINKNTDLSTQISYSNNRLNSDYYSNTQYFLPDSTIITDLGEHAYSKQNRLSADIVLTTNAPSYYLKNKLNADLLWDDIRMHTSGSFLNTQIGSIPHRQFSNDFEMLKRSGSKTYTLNSFNAYQAKPHSLGVEREGNNQQQEVHSSAFYTNTYTSMAFYLEPVTLSLRVGIVGVIRSMQSELAGFTDTLGQVNNDMTMRYANLYASPELKYKKNGIEATFDMPVSFMPYQYQNKMTANKHTTSKLLLSPKLYLRYHFTSRFYASVSGRLTQNPVEEQQFYEGVVLKNYRNIVHGFVDYNTGHSKTLNLALSYKKPLRAFFANANVSRSWNKNARISNRSFVDDYILTSYAPYDNTTDTWLVSGSISKGLDWIGGMISLRSSYMMLNSSIFQHTIETPFSSEIWSISPKINARMSTWSNVSYEFEYTSNQMGMDDSEMQISSGSITQTFSLNINPRKQWYLQLVGQHYYNKMTEDLSKHLFLADAEFTYSFGNGLELNLSVKNMFNQKEYEYLVNDGLTSTRKAYKIRSRDVIASVFFRF